MAGCAFEVMREAGHGLHEKLCENALVLAFRDAGIGVRQQSIYPINFKRAKLEWERIAL
jgi:GxxExxY protein